MFQNKCVAVILAGGKSARMRQPKGLLLYKGHYWLQEHLKRLKEGGIKEVIIGLGYEVETYYKAIPELQKALRSQIIFNNLLITVVQNETPENGPFSTLKKCLKNIDASSDALICPIDVPIINATNLKQLIKTKSYIVKPIYNNQSGHPIKINNQFVRELLNEKLSARLDELITTLPKDKINKIPCIDSQIILNLNTPKDWENYRVSKFNY